MSTVVDERVVSMQFDNANFEKNVGETMSTLDKLKAKLNFSGASKGLEEVNDAAKGVDMSFLSNGVEAVRAKFSALQIMGITALQNITNSAVNAGKRLVSSLTIDPIKMGLSEYETQLNSVQTILANTESKGSTLKDVNRALDELNLYADKTIYNFTEMTRNIGTFTAAGVELDTSVAAIKGIANLAAVSGSTSQQASTAMYQLSQALSSGTVKLMDWNSVVNAGMGGQVFQDALKETARVHGVAIDNMIKEQGSFRETLQKGWLTSEILLETLNKFTGDLSAEQLKSMGYTDKQIEGIIKMGQTANDAATKVKTFTQLIDTLKEAAQSGWTSTWEIIVGDFGEAKEMWTKVSDVFGGIIGASADARNKLLDGALTTGWKQLMGAGIMDEDGFSFFLEKVARDHGVAIDKMIEEEGSLEKAVKKGLSTGEISADMMKEALNRVTDAIVNMKPEYQTNMKYTQKQIEDLAKLNEEVQNGTISMEEFAEKIERLSGRELIMQSFANVFKAITKVITPLKEAFREIFPPTTSDQLYNLIVKFQEFTSKLIISDETAEKLRRTFKGLFAVVDIALTLFKNVVSVAWNLFKVIAGLGGNVLNITSSFSDFILRLRDTVKESTLLADIGNVVIGVVARIIDGVKQLGEALAQRKKSPFIEGLFRILTVLWNFAGQFFTRLSNAISNGKFFEFIENLLDIFLTGGLIALVNSIKGMFDGVGDIIENIGGIFEGFGDCLSAFQSKVKAEALKSIAVAVAILAASIVVLALIDPEKLDNSLAALLLAFTALMGVMAVLTKINFKGIRTITLLTGVATALLILSASMAILSTLSWNGIAKGLVAMIGALGIMTGTIYLLTKIEKANMATKGAKQFTKMAFGLLILAGALKILSTITWGGIARSLLAMLGALAIMTGTIFILSKIEKANMATKGATQFVIMAVGLGILGVALKTLATMDWGDIARALMAMGGSLAILAGTLKLMSMISKKGSSVAALVVLIPSLIALAIALKFIGSMDWGEVARALTALTVSLGVLVGALLLLTKLSNNGVALIASAAALVIFTGAVALLVPTLVALGNLKTSTIIKALVTLAASFAILGAAGILLKGAIPAILGFAAALALIGVAMLGIGIGMGAMLTGISALITALVAGGATLVATILGLLKGVVELFPLIFKKFGEALISLLEVIRDAAPIIGQTVVALLFAILDILAGVIGKFVPAIVKIVFELFVGVIEGLAEHVPRIVGALFKLIIGIINTLADYIPDLVQALFNVFMSVFDGMIEVFKTTDPKIFVNAILCVGAMSILIAALSAIAALIPGAMIGVLGMGAVMVELAAVLAVIGAIGKIPGLNNLIASGGKLLENIGIAIGRFVGGILGGIAQGATSTLPAIGTNLSDFMTNLAPFLNAIKLLDASVLDNAKTLASVILTLTAANLIDSLTSWLTGGVSLSAFATELASFGSGIKQFANETTGIDPTTVAAAAEAGKNLGDMAKNIPTSGGLWQLIAGKKDLSSFADQLKSFGKAVNSFATEVDGVDGQKALSAAEAGIKIGEMAKNMPTSGGLWSWIAGKKDMTSVANQLKSYGEGIKGFHSAIGGVDMEAVNAGTDAGMKIAEMAGNMPTSGGLWGWIAGKKDMSNIGKQLTAFGEGLAGFVLSVTGMGNADQVVAVVDTLTNCLTSFSTTGLSNMVSSLQASRNKVVDTINSMLISAITLVQSKSIIFAETCDGFMSHFTNAIDKSGDTVAKSLTDALNDAVNTIKAKEMYNKFYSAGEYIVQGLAAGIDDNASTISTKVTNMANNAISAAKTALGINSPSKEFRKLGYGTGEGLIEGVDEYGDKTYAAGASLGQKLIDGMKYAAAKIADLIENGVDQPTITPVLDLSNVTAGIGAMNGMFNASPSVGVLSRVGSINSSVNQIQNGANSDVISAIDRLENAVKNSSGDKFVIDNISINGDTELEQAMNTIIKKARIERRK